MAFKNENAPKLVPSRIRQARLSRGLSLSDLADLVNVSRQAISQCELGTKDPSDGLLLKITDILKYPLSFFYKPVSTQASNYSSSVTFFRSRKTTAAKLKEAAEEKLKIFNEIDEYIRNYVNFPNIDLPSPEIDLINNEPSIEDIENLALRVRKYWGLGLGPIPNVISVLQQKGFMISKMHLGNKKIDAFSKWFNNVPYIFLGSDKYSCARSRFDVSHELGHLLLHTFLCDKDLEINEKNKLTEEEADRFAAAFLLPEETFAPDVFSSSINHFIMLKKKWKVSISCMIRRCDNLNLLSENQITYLKNQMTRLGYWRSEPLDDVLDPEKPYAYKQAIQLILDNNVLSINEIIDGISCYPEEIEEYCFLERGTLMPKLPNNIISLKDRIN